MTKDKTLAEKIAQTKQKLLEAELPIKVEILNKFETLFNHIIHMLGDYRTAKMKLKSIIAKTVEAHECAWNYDNTGIMIRTVSQSQLVTGDLTARLSYNGNAIKFEIYEYNSSMIKKSLVHIATFSKESKSNVLKFTGNHKDLERISVSRFQGGIGVIGSLVATFSTTLLHVRDELKKEIEREGGTVTFESIELQEFGWGIDRCGKEAKWHVKEEGKQCVGFQSETQARAYANRRGLSYDEGPCDDC